MTSKKTVEVSKRYNAPIAVLFNAIKDGRLLRSTGVKANSFKHDFRVGGEYSLEWTSATAGSCSGRYLQIEPDKLIQFTWNSRGCTSAPSSETIVTVSLLEAGEYTEMKLVHEGLDAGFCYDDHLAGWTSSVDDFNAEIEQLISIA